MSALTLTLFACGGAPKSGHDHDGHDHAAEAGTDHDGHDHEHEGHDHEAEEAAGAHAEGTTKHIEGEIILHNAQAAALGLQYSKVTPATFSSAIRTWGVVEPAAGDAVIVAATMSGIVTSRLTLGAKVTKGQTLFTINSSSLSRDNMSEQIANARAEVRRAKADLERVESLVAQKLATQAEYQQALLSKTQAENLLRTLTQGTSEGGVRRIVSPMSGYITALEALNGNYVDQGATMATVSANQKIVVRADLPQRYASWVPQIKGLNFTLENSGDASGASFTSKELLSGGHASTGGVIAMRFSVENRAELLPGAVVEAFLLGREMENTIAVPVASITDEQGQKFVYLRMAPDVYVKRHVKLGQSNGQTVEILEGLKAGDDVVVRGAYFVRLAASSTSSVPHGHSH